MSLILLIRNTIYSEKKMIFAYCINTLILILIFNLMMDKVSIIYPVSVSLYILIFYLAFKAYSLYTFFDELENSKKAVRNTYTSEKIIESSIFKIINEIHTSYNDKLSKEYEKLKQRNLLISQFVHNMKSSVSVIELATAKNSVEVIDDILLENEKQKSHLEQLLNILRFDEFYNDYIPESIDILTLLTSVINSKRRDFVYSRVFPKIKGTSTYVYTDKKWCFYIIDQIILNAIKYSEEGKNIYFEIIAQDNYTYLKIIDEGIGIQLEDLPRVFELFYTGKNGRENKNSTGIGLTMVKHIAKKLGHEVSINSTEGVGTCVTISFLSKM